MDQNAVQSVAVRNGIPPAILSAIASKLSGRAGMGMNTAALAVRGFHAADLADNDALSLELAARTLKEGFKQTNSWDSALSYYFSGDPKAYSNPNDTIGGMVYSILGAAASDPTLGLQNLSPEQMQTLGPTLAAFGQYLQGEVKNGGVITPDKLSAFSKYLPAQTGGPSTVGQGYDASGPGPGTFAGNNFPWGQCTWFAAGVRPDIIKQGIHGDAWEWGKWAKDKTPTIGAAVVYGQGNGYDAAAGHVGIVTAINPDGTFQVTSDHWSGLGNTHVGTSTMRDVEGFIPAPSPQEGAQAAQRALDLAGNPQKQKVEIPQAIAAAAPAGSATQKQAVEQIRLAKESTPAVKPTNPQAQQKPTAPAPQQVNDFAQQIKALGIDLNQFNAQFGNVTKMFRSQGGTPPSLAQWAQIQHLDPSQLLEYVRNQPHPRYPSLTLGAMSDTFNSATLHSIQHVTRMPYETEAAKLATAGANWQQMSEFYKGLGQSQPAPTAPQPPAAGVSAGVQRRVDRVS